MFYYDVLGGTRIYVFDILKRCNLPVAPKDLNYYLIYSAKLAEANISTEFNRECIDLNRHPKFYSKSSPHNRIYAHSKTLKRYALNQ